MSVQHALYQNKYIRIKEDAYSKSKCNQHYYDDSERSSNIQKWAKYLPILIFFLWNLNTRFFKVWVYFEEINTIKNSNLSWIRFLIYPPSMSITILHSSHNFTFFYNNNNNNEFGRKTQDYKKKFQLSNCMGVNPSGLWEL